MRTNACARCGGSYFYDRFDDETRCLSCARPAKTVEPLPYVITRPSMKHEAVSLRERETIAYLKEHPGLTSSELATIAYLKEHPGLTSSELAVGMGLARKTMDNRLMNMYSRQTIQRQGKGGNADPYRWEA